MLEPFAFDYAQMVFFCTFGVLQYVASKNNLLGIMILRTQLGLTQIVSSILIISSFSWFFFLGEPRNIPDTGPGLEANTQTIVFASSSAFAIAITFMISSIINHKWGTLYIKNYHKGKEAKIEGIAAFQKTTFYWVILKFLLKY